MSRLVLALISTLLIGMGMVGAQTLMVAPGNEHFQRTWERTDKPVLDGVVARTWMWGPEAFTDILTEPYAESPGGRRDVQYFDKSRMEITHPDGDASSIWYVTNGLLVNELMTGRMQVGDATFEQRKPAPLNVAGDADDPNGPTYETFAMLRDVGKQVAIRGDSSNIQGGDSIITATVDRDGNIGDDSSLTVHGVTAAQFVPETGHTVASVFWDFMGSSGPVMQAGEIVTAPIFENPFFATGFPVTEAFWSPVVVGGTERIVLIQAFERRILTFTPGNPEGFLVEAGNVGQHYYAWRSNAAYDIVEPPVEPTPSPTASAPLETPTVTATTMASPTESPTFTATATATETEVPPGTVAPTPPESGTFFLIDPVYGDHWWTGTTPTLGGAETVGDEYVMWTSLANDTTSAKLWWEQSGNIVFESQIRWIDGNEGSIGCIFVRAAPEVELEEAYAICLRAPRIVNGTVAKESEVFAARIRVRGGNNPVAFTPLEVSGLERLNPFAWHHLAVSADGRNLNFWADGNYLGQVGDSSLGEERTAIGVMVTLTEESGFPATFGFIEGFAYVP